jgi:hypothetical protein
LDQIVIKWKNYIKRLITNKINKKFIIKMLRNTVYIFFIIFTSFWFKWVRETGFSLNLIRYKKIFLQQCFKIMVFSSFKLLKFFKKLFSIYFYLKRTKLKNSIYFLKFTQTLIQLANFVLSVNFLPSEHLNCVKKNSCTIFWIRE